MTKREEFVRLLADLSVERDQAATEFLEFLDSDFIVDLKQTLSNFKERSIPNDYLEYAINLLEENIAGVRTGIYNQINGLRLP